MAEITAVILAAGRGVRMGARGELTPKGLIEIGGSSLMAQSVATLRDWGAARIRIVTGHLAEQYEAAFAGANDVELIYNDRYATTGSLRSLAVGLEGVDGPCVIVESDLLYAPQALVPIDGTCNRFVVSGPTEMGDEVYVWAHSVQAGPQHLIDMSKDPNMMAEPHLGEMVGITGLTAEATARMKRLAAQTLARDPEEHYEPPIVALARQTAIEVYLIEDLAWCEIDDEEMLTRAQARIYPKVEAARAAF